MDISIVENKIKEIVEKAKGDEGFLKKLKSDPVKTIEDLIGVDLPDEQVKAVAQGVMAKLNMEDAKDFLGGIGDKIGGMFNK